jgi:transcriptional regulator GlxA family with amidase domain
LYQAGQVYLVAQPDHPITTTVEDTDGEIAMIDPALPSQVADTAPGRTRQPVRFTGYDPVSPHAARLLVAVTLNAFPNNARTDPTIEDRHDAHTGTLRRAVAFIDEHAHEDIAITDIAAAAYVTVRALQLAFRRHLDTTPTEYLRRVRLDHAHHDLIAADPATITVTAVAYRWGFSSPSRFTADYRQTYGITPSRTLHRT